MSAVILTTISALRSTTTASTGEIYYTTDLGQEGAWRCDGVLTGVSDNTGLTLVSSNSTVFNRIYENYICVDWFGAKGDGITNNTSAIQLAVDTLTQIGGGTLYFKFGDYKTNTIVISSSILTNSDKVYIKGAGKMSTRISGYPRLTEYYDSITPAECSPETPVIPSPIEEPQVPVFRIEGSTSGSATAFLSISDLTIIGNNEDGCYYVEGGVYKIITGFTYNGIETNCLVVADFENFEIKGCEICLICNGSLEVHFGNFLIGGSDGDKTNTAEYSNFGVKIDRNSITANAIHFSDGVIKCCKYNALRFSEGNELSFSNVTFELNGDVNVYPVGGVELIRPLSESAFGGNFVSIINFTNCWFEHNEGYTIYLAEPDEQNDNLIINIIGCFFAELESGGVSLSLCKLADIDDEGMISKVNIIGTASKLPNFEIIAQETDSIGSSLDNFKVNSILISTITITTHTYKARRDYLNLF